MLVQILHNYWEGLRGFGYPFVLVSYGIVLGTSAVLALMEMISIRRAGCLRFVLALLGSFLAFALAIWQWLRGGSFHLGVFEVDRYSLFFSIIILGTMLLFLCQTRGSREASKEPSEIYSLLFLSVLGALATVHAQNLLALYLGMEMTMLPLIAWIAAGRAGWRANEVMAKLYLTGGLGSLLLLFGVALIYADGGVTSLTQVFASTSEDSLSHLKDIGIMFFVGGLACKMAWFPFHLNRPDIYQGGQTVAVGYFAIISKLVGVMILSRIISSGWSPGDLSWSQLLGVAAVLALIIGPLQALQQMNLKRRLAYASIGQTGFLLLGLAAAGKGTGLMEKSIEATVFYLFAHTLMFVGVTAAMTAAARRGDEPLEISDYAGLAESQPWLAAALSLFLLGLAGIPATIGFIGKFYLIRVALEQGLTVFAILALVGWILLAYASLEVVVTLYFKPPREYRVVKSGYPLIVTISICALLTVYWGFVPSTILQLIRESVRVLLF